MSFGHEAKRQFRKTTSNLSFNDQKRTMRHSNAYDKVYLLALYFLIILVVLAIILMISFAAAFNRERKIVGSRSKFKATGCVHKKYEALRDHSGCRTPGPKFQKTYKMSDSDRRAVVDLHNELRRQEPGSNLHFIFYDKSIEEVIERHLSICNLEHDKQEQRDDPTLPGHIGQNLGSITSVTVDVLQFILDMTQGWYSEKKYFRFGDKNDFRKVGHYVQVVASHDIRIGCAAVYCVSNINMGCNYYYYEPHTIDVPYIRGKPCNLCRDGCHCNDGLCDCGRSFVGKKKDNS
ncbi:hypothetical protein SNEBB_004878 [Seison nebaliae]|nr:hypothetical protein SNEBB_004878 [Seison nebaliae]